MRLIDADALKENFPLPCEEWEMKGQQTLWHAREIRETIDLMPTVEERKKGKWKDCGTVIFERYKGFAKECSECHSIIIGGGNFCNECGADMRGDADETD